MAADAGGDDADRPGTGNEHVFADQVVLQGTVRGIAEGVKKCRQFGRNGIRNRPKIAGRHDHVFSKSTIAVDADADGVGAQMLLAGATVTTHTADDVALGRDPLTDLVTLHALACGHNAADKFMSNHQWCPDVALRPFIPTVNVQIGTADGSFLDFDQYLVVIWLRHRHLAHADASGRLILDEGTHAGGHFWLRIQVR